MVEYQEWLANVVHVLKKDNKVKVYVDFRDLNKEEMRKILEMLKEKQNFKKEKY